MGGDAGAPQNIAGKNVNYFYLQILRLFQYMFMVKEEFKTKYIVSIRSFACTWIYRCFCIAEIH